MAQGCDLVYGLTKGEPWLHAYYILKWAEDKDATWKKRCDSNMYSNVYSRWQV